MKEEKHTHQLKNVHRMIHLGEHGDLPRYMLVRVCETCPYELTYDLVVEPPAGVLPDKK